MNIIVIINIIIIIIVIIIIVIAVYYSWDSISPLRCQRHLISSQELLLSTIIVIIVIYIVINIVIIVVCIIIIININVTRMNRVFISFQAISAGAVPRPDLTKNYIITDFPASPPRL